MRVAAFLILFALIFARGAAWTVSMIGSGQ